MQKQKCYCLQMHKVQKRLEKQTSKYEWFLFSHICSTVRFFKNPSAMNFNMHTKNNIRGHFLKIKSEVFQTILED